MSTTEDTLNDLLADYLRSKGVNITTQSSVHGVSGGRKPDFELHVEGKIYYGEGEWLSTYYKGLLQALDFGRLPGAAGYFILGYPDKLKGLISERRLVSSDPDELLKGGRFERCLFGFEDKRSDLQSVSLEQLPDWIQVVTHEEKSSPDPVVFVNLLRHTVESLANYLPRTKTTIRLFEHIVATIPKADEEEAARKASAYLLLNQIFFYRPFL